MERLAATSWQLVPLECAAMRRLELLDRWQRHVVQMLAQTLRVNTRKRRVMESPRDAQGTLARVSMK